MKSIERADYFGSRRPHLTIELPPDPDPPLSRFLENLVWPPIDWSGSPHASQVTLRRRIPRHQTGPEEASVHFIENFYPSRSRDSHVLLLSPQVELSPLYYQYLLYHVLEYKYSSYGFQTGSENLMGISLHLPSRYLNDTEPFAPPPNLSADPDTITNERLPFLWQAPNSNAALYFGEQWMELQSFVTSRMYTRQTSNHPIPFRPKQVSPNHPSWMEYLLELMRIRSYSLLYPNLPSSAALATVHNELYHPPEEFTTSHSTTPDNSPPPPQNINDPFTANPAPQPPPPDSAPPLLTTPLLTILPNAGDLPSLSSLPMLSYAGDPLTLPSGLNLARSFRKEFRRDIGGCKDKDKDKIKNKNGKQHTSPTPPRPLTADDLFCFDTHEEEIDEVADTPTGSRREEERKEAGGDVYHTNAQTDLVEDEGPASVEKERKSMLDEYAEHEAERLEKEARDMKVEFQRHLVRQGSGGGGGGEGGGGDTASS